jgi:hypothetical protein
MINHESHLKSILETQRTLSNEMTELNNILSSKRQEFTKLQGIVEYLTSNGITPEASGTPEESEKTELPEQ